ncbi:MAG TPA: hypothetical protein VNE38_13620 [Ktedonobacteraceae bacterium]|nr:hypothetical protein [Ktedonobacteraceae bacterium]
MDTSNQREPSAHSMAFHEEQLALFDAYLTDELDEDERAQVEQHRQRCQECQQLFAGVAHLRHALGTLSETKNLAVPEHAHPHSSPVLQAVMARLEEGNNSWPNLILKGGYTMGFLSISISSQPLSGLGRALERQGHYNTQWSHSSRMLLALATFFFM